jgi:hypothetical protein
VVAGAPRVDESTAVLLLLGGRRFRERTIVGAIVNDLVQRVCESFH